MYSKQDLDQLRGMLTEIEEALGAAIEKAEIAASFASQMGGEVDKVVAGQLGLYLRGTLEAFIGNVTQGGSVEGLRQFLDEEIGEGDED